MQDNYKCLLSNSNGIILDHFILGNIRMKDSNKEGGWYYFKFFFYFFLFTTTLKGSLVTNLDSAIYFYQSGKFGKTLSCIGQTNYLKLNFIQKELWWKLKFDCDYEVGRLEIAKADAASLQQLRASHGHGNYYLPEYYAMLAHCYHGQIRADSAFQYSLKALKVFRSNAYSGDSIDVYRLYMSHAAASRNQIEKAYQSVYNKSATRDTYLSFSRSFIPACFDTAVKWASQLKLARDLTIARIFRGKANYFLDYANAANTIIAGFSVNWYYHQASTDYEKSNKHLKKISPAPFFFLAYNHSLMGLLNHNMKNYKLASDNYEAAQLFLNSEKAKEEQSTILYTQLVLSQFMSVNKTRLFLLTGDANYLNQCIIINERAISPYLDFLNSVTSNTLPYRDVYSINPLGKLVECEVELYFKFRQKRNIDRALFYLNLNAEIAQNRFSADSLNRLVKEFRKAQDKRMSNHVSDIMRKAIDLDECLLIYWDSNTELSLGSSLCFVLSRDSTYVKRVLTEVQRGYNTISQSGSSVFSQFKDSSEASTVNYLKRAGEKYYGQIKKYIPASTRKLRIVANRELSFLPFEALVVDSAGMAHYLLEYYATNYLSVPKDVIMKNKSKSLVEGMTVFNNTKNSAGKIIYPFSQSVGEKLYSKYSAGFAPNKINKQAFMEACQADNKIVHVFSHAAANPNNIKKSFIVFGNDSLTINDILNLNFNCDLLCLMACEIDYGDYDPNAGKVTLAPVFIKNGIKTLVTTQWLVDDKVCSIISEKFYKYLFSGNSASEALRKAKLELMKTDKAFAGVLYWGAFRLIGQDQYFENGLLALKFKWILLLIIVFLLLSAYLVRRSLK